MEDPVDTLRDHIKLGKEVYLDVDKVSIGEQGFPRDLIVNLPKGKKVYTLEQIWFLLKYYSSKTQSDYVSMSQKYGFEKVGSVTDQKTIVSYLAPRGVKKSLLVDRSSLTADQMDTQPDDERKEEDNVLGKRERESDLNDYNTNRKKQKKLHDPHDENWPLDASAPQYNESFDPFVDYDRTTLESFRKKEIALTTRTTITTGRVLHYNEEPTTDSQKKRMEKESNLFGHICDVAEKVKKSESERKKSEVKQPPAQPQAAPRRYDEKALWKNNGIEHEEFHIDTRGSNMDLKSMPPGLNHQSKPTSHTGQRHPAPSSSGRKKPIIIVPAALSSLITLYNVGDFVVGNKYVSNEEKKKEGAKKEAVVIRRKVGQGSYEEYMVIDNPTKLPKEEWRRVVAVFTNGQSWQFSGWNSEDPMKIFNTYQGFHLHFTEDGPNAAVKNWPIKILSISKIDTLRHNDQTSVREFWKTLDDWMKKRAIQPFIVQH
ncbi:parafibromin [Acrasis kona]|uniref:Parafibromin n=1 Tax=Acrasis kona TaxID=1008807 RepID=A0AAW2ZJX8_9EUKA